MISINEDRKKLMDDILTLQQKELEACDDLRALYISMLNHHNHHNDHSCTEKGVDIRVGDI